MYFYRPNENNVELGVQWREFKFNDDQTISLKDRGDLGCLALKGEGSSSRFVIAKDNCMKFSGGWQNEVKAVKNLEFSLYEEGKSGFVLGHTDYVQGDTYTNVDLVKDNDSKRIDVFMDS